MAVELEWRIDGEVADKARQEGHPPRRSRWPGWLGLVGVVLLVVGVGLYFWWRGRYEALATIEAEVQAVAQLELHALVEGDVELYLSLQDDADPNWQEAQEARATGDALLPPPLPSLPATTALSVEKARVVGDVARVEVVRKAGLPGEEMAPFRAIRFYRRSDDGRWLHTRTDLGYAGHIVIFVGRRVRISSFATDVGRMEPIVTDLERLADRFCSQFEGLVSCQQDAPLPLVFTGTLDAAVEPGGILPAPFVAGVPDDEAARAAWEAGFRELLLDRLIAREVGHPVSSAQSEPRGGELFRVRFREWLRAKLELSAPISPRLDLIGQALDAGEWISLRTLWNFTPADDDPRRPLAEAEIDLLLAFIEEEYDQSTLINLLYLYAPREVPRIEPLIWEALRGDWPAFEHRYNAYAREVTGRPFGLPVEGAAFAEYDLVAACGEPSDLWGLRLDRPEMTPLSSGAGLDALSWSPDGSRLLAWRGMAYGGGLYLLEADGSDVRQLMSVPAWATPVNWSPDGSYVAYSTFGRSLEEGLVDVEADERVALGSHYHLAWSPDGSQLAYLTLGSRLPLVWLAEGNGSNPRQVGEGYSVAWSPDGTRIAFFSTDSVLKIYDVAMEETKTLLDSAMLYNPFDFGGERSFVSVPSLFWSPTGEWIGFGVSQFGRMKLVKGGVALIRPDGGDLRIPFTREAGVAVTGWSPDGRCLTSIIYDRYDRAQFTTTVIGIDGVPLLEVNAEIAWSPDGRYLAVIEMDRSRILRILEIESATWYSFDSSVRCESLAWNPRGPFHQPVPGSGYTPP